MLSRSSPSITTIALLWTEAITSALAFFCSPLGLPDVVSNSKVTMNCLVVAFSMGRHASMGSLLQANASLSLAVEILQDRRPSFMRITQQRSLSSSGEPDLSKACRSTSSSRSETKQTFTWSLTRR